MSGEQLKWEDLKVLLALLEFGSLNQAAKELSIPQSTASRRLARLELELDQVLFDRTPDGVRPTQLAFDLAPFANEIAAQMNEIQRATSLREREPSGRVTLALPDGIASHLLIPNIGGFLNEFPEIEIDFLIGNAVLDLVRREADLALRFIRPTSQDLVATKLTELKLGAFVHPDLVDIPFSKLPWVALADPNEQFTETHWLKNVAKPNRVHHCSSWNAMFAGAKSGIGAAILADPVAEAAGLVRIAKNKKRPESRVLFLVYHYALRHVPRITALREWLKSQSNDIERLARA